MDNLFLKAMGVKDTFTENGAVSNSSSGMAIIDQFATAGNFRDRAYLDVSNDQETLWRENSELAMRFPFYLRMITRNVKVNDKFVSEKVQNGQGVRDESFKRLLSIAENHSNSFYKNIWLLPIVGSWKDLWTLMYYDIKMSLNVLDHKIMFSLMKEALANESHIDLFKKFMPRIKSRSKLKTDWTKVTNDLAIEFATFMGWSKKEYNKVKTSGKAHDFQKLISEHKYTDINWSLIPGRALSKLVSSKFIENHGLADSYVDWLSKQDVVKFTGYPYELAKSASNARAYENVTIDKQFDGLIQTANENGNITENVWCALDTSGSMITPTAANVSAMDICMSLGIYFSELNTGAFHNNVIMFDNVSHIKKLDGTFTEKLRQIPRDAMGGTNFQSVVDEIVRVRRNNPSIPLEDYPTSLLIVSDMQFNPSSNSLYGIYGIREFTPNEEAINTNYEEMKRKLYEVFPTEFVDSMKFIWWNVASRTKDFPARMEDGGCYLFSGYDGSIINMLLGREEEEKTVKKSNKTMEEMVLDALSQEILLLVKE